MKVYVIGIGPGNPELLTRQAQKIIEICPVLTGDARMLQAFQNSGKKLLPTYKTAEIKKIAANLTDGPLGVLVSGDVGFFSLAALLNEIPVCEVSRVPGISSLVYFAAALKTSWQDAFIVSRHGRNYPLAAAVRQHKKVFVITGGDDSPAALCRELCAAGLGEVKVALGCNLSYANELICQSTAAEIAKRGADPLAVLMIFNEQAAPWQRPVHGLPDTAFLRGKVPMTKQEIRSVALSKLAPSPEAVIYDIGAGTGSCTVELALQAPLGQVYSFEINPAALALLKENIQHFSLANVTVVEGNAADTLKHVNAVPNYVFIGGTKGNLTLILDEVYTKNPVCAVVITAITLETVAAVTAYYAQHPEYSLEITQITAARSKKAGSSHLMIGENPVYIMEAR